MTRSNALTALTERGIDEQLLNSLKTILDTCEYARYAPASTEQGTPDIYEKASQFIKSVENLLT